MASPFASLTTSEPIPLPFDAGQWVQVRKLTGKEYEQAQASHRAEFAAGGNRAWALAFRRMLEKGAGDPEVRRAIEDPVTGFDRYAVVQAGLVAWSYDRPTDAASVADLDDDAVDFIARAVLRLTKPALFGEDAEAAQKKG